MRFGLDGKYQHRSQMSTNTLQFIANLRKRFQFAEKSKYCSKTSQMYSASQNCLVWINQFIYVGEIS
jgi:hypothetical protein